MLPIVSGFFINPSAPTSDCSGETLNRGYWNNAVGYYSISRNNYVRFGTLLYYNDIITGGTFDQRKIYAIQIKKWPNVGYGASSVIPTYFKIWMRNTGETGNAYPSTMDITNSTLVLDSNNGVEFGDGNNLDHTKFTLSTPFTWDGTGNVDVIMEWYSSSNWGSGNWWSDNGFIEYYSVAVSGVNHRLQTSSTSFANSVAGVSNSRKFRIRADFQC